MVKPQASSSEKKVTSKYWAGESPSTTLRGKSVPALGSKRNAPECDDSTGQEAEHLRRKHAKTFNFKPAHAYEVEVKDEPVSTQPPSDQPLPPSNQPKSTTLRPTADSSIPIEPLPPTVTATVRLPSSTVPVKTFLPQPTTRLTSSKFPANSSSPLVAVKPACQPSNSEASVRCQKPSPKTRDFHEEEAVITTVVHICDESVTEATINLVLRWGREAPNLSGDNDDLGITYLEGILARIDKRGIEPARRVVVVDLMISKLIRHLEDLRLRVGTLSAPQAHLPLSPPSIDRPVQPGGSTNESDRRNDHLSSHPLVTRGNDGYITQSGLRHRLEQQMTSAEDIDTDQEN
jgi:hypothetical protein